VGVLGAPVLAQKTPALPDLLKLTNDYLVQYGHQLGAVAADEEFMQYETSTGRMGTPKRVNSVVVLLGQDDGTIGSFRDVVAIDNVPVRPKDDRLAALFRKPSQEGIGTAQTMTDDAVNAYIDKSLHILDKLTLALDLLRPDQQANWTYKIEGMKSLDGVQVAVLKFTEKGKGHLMPNAAAVGRYWIDPADGSIHQTELGFSAQNANIHGTIKFAKDAGLGLFVPTELAETIEVSAGGTGMGEMGGATGQGQMGGKGAFEGRATIGKYRRVGS
jgi:hypothetical protein